jgi:hypothetical protein
VGARIASTGLVGLRSDMPDENQRALKRLRADLALTLEVFRYVLRRSQKGFKRPRHNLVSVPEVTAVDDFYLWHAKRREGIGIPEKEVGDNKAR